MTNPLRSLLVPGRGTLIPGAANALGARIAESTGFKADVGCAEVGVGEAGAGEQHGLTTMTEVAQQLSAMLDASGVAIIADVDTGFDNALNVVRTVRMFESSGADALQIEDQTFPKRCGHFDGKDVVPAMIQKIKAAVDTRKRDTLILARQTRTHPRGCAGHPRVQHGLWWQDSAPAAGRASSS